MSAPEITGRFPLAWPLGRPKTRSRQFALWRHEGRRLTLDRAMRRLREQVNMLTKPGQNWRVKDQVLTTNLELRRDGHPRADRRRPTTSGRGVLLHVRRPAARPRLRQVGHDRRQRRRDRRAHRGAARAGALGCGGSAPGLRRPRRAAGARAVVAGPRRRRACHARRDQGRVPSACPGPLTPTAAAATPPWPASTLLATTASEGTSSDERRCWLWIRVRW
jgi:hypothetical protein